MKQNFSNKKVLRTFTTPHSMNCYAFIESLGWRRVKPGAADAVTNMFMVLNAARANGLTIRGQLLDNRLNYVYL